MAYTELTRPSVHRRPVHGTGLELSPQGFEDVPVGMPEGVVVVPAGEPVAGGVARVGVVGVAGVDELAGVVVGVHAATTDKALTDFIGKETNVLKVRP